MKRKLQGAGGKADDRRLDRSFQGLRDAKQSRRVRQAAARSRAGDAAGDVSGADGTGDGAAGANESHVRVTFLQTLLFVKAAGTVVGGSNAAPKGRMSFFTA